MSKDHIAVLVLTLLAFSLTGIGLHWLLNDPTYFQSTVFGFILGAAVVCALYLQAFIRKEFPDGR